MTAEQPDFMRTSRFAPGWPLWLFTLFFLPVLIALGMWQLDRAAEKRALQAQIDRFQQTAAQPVTAFNTQPPSAWQPLRMTGQFDTQYMWLLDNRLRDGQPGVEVLQLFHESGSGRDILVNRGWLHWGDRRQLPVPPTPSGEVSLVAEQLPIPDAGFTLSSPTTDGWPKLVGSIELPVIAAQAHLDTTPWLVRLQSGSAAALRLDWPPLAMSSSKHTGYAVQWFAMAGMLLILFIWAGIKPVTSRRGDDQHDGSQTH